VPIRKAVSEALLANRPFYSLEFFPPKNPEDWPGFFATAERLRALNPLFASVTYGAGGSTQENTLEITSRLAKMHLEPMAHLTCVGATRASLRDFLQKLRANNVTAILALRGDPPKQPAEDNTPYDWNAGEFCHASDLVNFVRAEFPEFTLSVAAYPTPHPESPSYEADRNATADKLKHSDFGISQLFFDPRDYFEMVRQLRNRGVSTPVLPGILPIQSFASIRRVLAMSGCNIPAKLYMAIEEAHEKGGTEAVKEAGIRLAIDQIKQLLDGGVPGVHLYTLNKAGMCLRIAEGVGPLT
jgi:5,10-methylenetetrahydrofolate reductase